MELLMSAVLMGRALGPRVYYIGSAVNIWTYLRAVSWRQVCTEDLGIISVQVIAQIMRVDDISQEEYEE